MSVTSSSDPPRPPLPRRLRLSIGAAVLVGLVALSAAVGLGIVRGQATSTTDTFAVPEATVSASGEMYVHVLGEVEAPGLYVLRTGARVADALAAAGGSRKTADLGAVNLARPLTDGEQIVVPKVGEASAAAGGAEGGPGADGLIDLNTADAATLDTLPGVGPAIAERIIAWREDQGRFVSVDDLLAVPGIGDKVLAGLRDSVRV